VGAAVTRELADHDVATPSRELGIPEGFHPHGTRAEILGDLGLTAQDVARRLIEWISRFDDEGPAGDVPSLDAEGRDAGSS
jgi:1-deoxy-D-xylulose-5-phosphate synthase